MSEQQTVTEMKLTFDEEGADELLHAFMAPDLPTSRELFRRMANLIMQRRREHTEKKPLNGHAKHPVMRE